MDRLGDEMAKVPDVFWHELRNLLLSAERRGRIDDRHADVSRSRLRRLPIRSSVEAGDRHVIELARDHRLTACGYLALAIREDCALASLDRRLTEAAAAEGVESLA